MYAPNQKKAHQAYSSNAVQTQSQGNLVIMLYDGVIKFLAQAVLAIGNNELGIASEKIIKAQNIIHELSITLNMEAGPIAEQLKDLYAFMARELINANIRKDVQKLQDVSDMVKELRDAFKQINVN